MNNRRHPGKSWYPEAVKAASERVFKTHANLFRVLAVDEMTHFDIKTILADPVLRRELMCDALKALQNRKGIDTTDEQAQAAYDRVQKEKESK